MQHANTQTCLLNEHIDCALISQCLECATTMAHQSNLQSWLDHLVKLLPQTERGFVVTPQSSGSIRVLASAPHQSRLPADISAIARSAADLQTPLIKKQGKQLLLAQPLGFRDGVVILGLANDKTNQHFVAHMLQWAIEWLQKIPAANQANTQLDFFNIINTPDLSSALQIVATDISDHFNIAEVSVVCVSDRRPSAMAVAHNTELHVDGIRRRDIEQTALAGLSGESVSCHLRQQSDAPNTPQQRLLKNSAHSCLQLLREECHDERMSVVFMLELPAPLDDDQLLSLKPQLKLVSALLSMHQKASRRTIHDTLNWQAIPYRWLTLGAIAALLLMLPVSHTIKGEASLESNTQYAITAPYDGSFTEALALVGDNLEAGQLLGRMDDKALHQEIRRLKNQHAEYEGDYRKHLAEQNYADARIVQSRIAQVEAAIDLANYQQQQSDVRSPIKGRLISGNPADLLGEQVQRGQLFFKVAPDNDYILSIRIHEKDIAYVHTGDSGQLSLNAAPDTSIAFKVSTISPLTEDAGESNFFIAYATLAEDAATIRPGMQGIAKINIGKRSIADLLFAEPLRWLKLTLWQWLP